MLEFDLGNTRLKWRLLDGRGTRLDGGACATEAFHHPWAQALAGSAGPHAARISSVASTAVNDMLQAQLVADDVDPIRFATSAARCGAVRAGYHQPERMGVDRWLAVVAAWNRCRAPVLVVDAGSAMTVDLVDGAGCHLGGWIVPGLALMRRSLLSGTAGIRFPEGALQDQSVPGRDTAEAVGFGTLAMLRDFVVERFRHFSAQHPGAVLVLTGGDAERLVAAAERDLEPLLRVPELVMDGLAHVLPSGSPAAGV